MGDRETRFRGDIEGLRAIAVLLVLVNHSGLAEPSAGFAGVDVFFVISGFVITTQLLREVEREGRVRLAAFYGRRAKRLLPAAGLVLLVTAVAALALSSRVYWRDTGTEIGAAALYVVNWLFLDRAVDYDAQDVTTSPVLHFWSLAVEEQFYLLWPALIIAVLLFHRWRRGSHLRRTLAITLLVLVVLPSFAYAVWYSAVNPQESFFATTTRLWELGTGALVAAVTPTLRRLHRRPALGLGWVGLTLLLVGVLVSDQSTPWPGTATLAPVLGTAAVIAAGCSDPHRFGAGRALAIPPLVVVGGLSYSLYLWHWPMLSIARWQWGELSVPMGIAVVSFSAVPAYLGYRFLEDPVRRSSTLRLTPRALLVGAVCSVLALGGGTMLRTAAGPVGGSTLDQAGGEDLAARAAPDLQEQVPPDSAAASAPPLFDTLTPAPQDATADAPTAYTSQCHAEVPDISVPRCDVGDQEGDVEVAVIGDSKVAQWVPALDTIAQEQGWALRVSTKSGCAFTDATKVVDDEGYEECRTWGQAVQRELLGPDAPDVVVTSSVSSSALPEGKTEGEPSMEGLVGGYERYWSALVGNGTAVIALSDTPQPGGQTVYECVAEHPEDALEQCSWDSDGGLGSPALRAAAEQVQGAQFVDINPWVCPDGSCVPVYRNVLTYRQGSHLTATYVRVLQEALAAQLVPLVEQAAATG